MDNKELIEKFLKINKIDDEIIEFKKSGARYRYIKLRSGIEIIPGGSSKTLSGFLSFLEQYYDLIIFKNEGYVPYFEFVVKKNKDESFNDYICLNVNCLKRKESLIIRPIITEIREYILPYRTKSGIKEKIKKYYKFKEPFIKIKDLKNIYLFEEILTIENPLKILKETFSEKFQTGFYKNKFLKDSANVKNKEEIKRIYNEILFEELEEIEKFKEKIPQLIDILKGD